MSAGIVVFVAVSLITLYEGFYVALAGYEHDLRLGSTGAENHFCSRSRRLLGIPMALSFEQLDVLRINSSGANMGARLLVHRSKRNATCSAGS